MPASSRQGELADEPSRPVQLIPQVVPHLQVVPGLLPQPAGHGVPARAGWLPGHGRTSAASAPGPGRAYPAVVTTSEWRSTSRTSASDAPAASSPHPSACRKARGPAGGPGPLAGPGDDAVDRRPVQRTGRGAHGEEDFPGSRRRVPACLQVGGDGLARVVHQRQHVGAAALAAQDDLPGPPPQVGEPEPGDLDAPRAVAPQQDQHRVVAQPGLGLAVAAVQQRRDSRRVQLPGQPGLPPGGRGDDLRERTRYIRPVRYRNRRNDLAAFITAPADGGRRCRAWADTMSRTRAPDSAASPVPGRSSRAAANSAAYMA